MGYSKMLFKTGTRKLFLYINSTAISSRIVRCSTKPSEVPKNVLEDYITAHKQNQNGSIYDKKPFRLQLEAGKKYFWCLCGKSKNQPFCDGTHKDVFLKIKQRPIKFEVEETKEYWLCQCKQTNRRPFCDGTHKSKLVQEGSSTVRQ